MTEPIINFDAVCKSFGPLEVLKDLSLSVQPRERIALIGPSGSGKTTILRILMTLENIQGGTVQIDGEQVWHEEKNGRLSQRARRTCAECAARSAWCFSSSTCFRT